MSWSALDLAGQADVRLLIEKLGTKAGGKARARARVGPAVLGRLPSPGLPSLSPFSHRFALFLSFSCSSCCSFPTSDSVSGPCRPGSPSGAT